MCNGNGNGLRKVVLKIKVSIILCRHCLKIMWDEQVMLVDFVMCRMDVREPPNDEGKCLLICKDEITFILHSKCLLYV